METQNQGEAAIEAVRTAVAAGTPFAIVFLDVRMPPGIDGIQAAKKIRALDPNVNIVIVTASMGSELNNLDTEIPPARQDFLFQKTVSRGRVSTTGSGTLR